MTCGECERCTEKSFIMCMVRSLLVFIYLLCRVYNLFCFSLLLSVSSYLYTVPSLVPVLLCMFDYYGLLGISVFCEHEAGFLPTPPTPLHIMYFLRPPLPPSWIRWKWAVIWRRKRGSSSSDNVPITSNKTGMKSLPRSLCF